MPAVLRDSDAGVGWPMIQDYTSAGRDQQRPPLLERYRFSAKRLRITALQNGAVIPTSLPVACVLECGDHSPLLFPLGEFCHPPHSNDREKFARFRRDLLSRMRSVFI